MEKFDQIAYISAYNEATYDRLTLRIPKGQKRSYKIEPPKRDERKRLYYSSDKKDCHE